MEIEVEGEEVDQVRASSSLTLVGCILTDRPIKAHTMKKRMARVWRSGRRVNNREAGQGIFLL